MGSFSRIWPPFVTHDVYAELSSWSERRRACVLSRRGLFDLFAEINASTSKVKASGFDVRYLHVQAFSTRVAKAHDVRIKYLTVAISNGSGFVVINGSEVRIRIGCAATMYAVTSLKSPDCTRT